MAQQQISISVPEAIARELRLGIIHGEYAPGQRLREMDIAQKLGVSNIPVREALQHLETEGLVVRIHRRGSYVREFSDDEIRDLFVVRAMLDAQLYRMLAQDGEFRADALDQLDSLVDQQAAAVEAGDFPVLAELDLAFHDVLYELAGSPLLTRFWQALRSQIKALLIWRSESLAREITETVVSGHEAILGNLRERNLAALKLHVETVLPRVGDEIVKALRGPG